MNKINQLIDECKNDIEKLSRLVDEYLIPSDLEKIKNAEVSTPYKLREEMLDLIPIEFWKTKQKIFEPCCGKGGFVISIISRYLKHSKFNIKEILEECLYFSDINSVNIYITKLLIDPDNQYNLNYNLGDTLNLDIKDKWNLEGFDIIIGNPPFNSSGTINTGNTIWQKFTLTALNDWVLNNGYLCFVHPAGWRKPEEENSKSKTKGMFKLMCYDNTMLNLVIRNTIDGKKTFNCRTRYDYYLIKKSTNNNILTKINDETYNDIKLNLREWEFLPNSNFDKIKNMITNDKEDRINIIYNRTNYGLDKKYVSLTKSEIFSYTLIRSTPIKDIKYAYSSCNDKGHFGISKLIFGFTGINNAILDINGEYGMTQGAFAIRLDNIEDIDKLKISLESTQFKILMKDSCSWGNYTLDWRLFTYLKKDFYKYF